MASNTNMESFIEQIFPDVERGMDLTKRRLLQQCRYGWNLVVACPTCNKRKWAYDPLEFLERMVS